ncbi:MAG TPA: pseudouridine synthase [Myxococcota bacterium]
MRTTAAPKTGAKPRQAAPAGKRERSALPAKPGRNAQPAKTGRILAAGKPGRAPPETRPERVAPQPRADRAEPEAPAERKLPDAKGETLALDKAERIAKVMARAGLCSRRDAERWIAEGRVSVNGKILTSPALTVTGLSDIRVDGKPIPAPERARLWRYHKPAGLVTSHRDEKGRPTVFDKLPEGLPRLVSIGRLDLNSEGLLLLTNDGELARSMELPSRGWLRRYKVRVHGAPEPERLAALAKGVTIEGVRYGPIQASFERQQGSNAWLTISIAEGKNREVRHIMEFLGLPVSRLIRLAYGPFQLGHLPRGEVDEVLARVVQEQLGLGKSGPQSAGKGEAGAGKSGASAPGSRPARLGKNPGKARNADHRR